jgi:cytochrome P450
MATIYIGRTPVVLLFRPEHVRYVLADNPGNFTNREVSGGLVFGNLLVLTLWARSLGFRVVQGLQDIVGDGLLTTDGDFHAQHRRLLQAAFTKPRVENHAGLIVQYIREAMERWRTDEEFDLAEDMQALVLRIIGRIILDVDVQNTEAGRFIEGILHQPIGLIEALLSLHINLPFTPRRRRDALLREVDDFLNGIIDERNGDHRDTGDVLSVLLGAEKDGEGAGLTRQQVRDELVNLLGAGYETTTNTVLWTFYLLARHPEALHGVLHELRSVLGGRDPEVADLARLTYLDWVIKESMRFYPSAWTQGRQASGPFELDGYSFPAGTLLMFSQWVLHRLPDIWGDPGLFRPERWDPAQGQKLPHWAYFPFGVGPRTCLGMSLAQLETRLILATILQRFTVSLAPDHPVIPAPLITLRLKHGLRVRMTPAPMVWPPAREDSTDVRDLGRCHDARTVLGTQVGD